MFSSRNFMVSGLKFKSDPFRVRFCVWCNKIVAQFHSFTYCILKTLKEKEKKIKTVKLKQYQPQLHDLVN